MEKTTPQAKKRLEYLDIAKGIGIFLVVWAHAKAPFTNYIYQFHMPFFFLISGLLYNSKDSVKTYTVKKIKGLYIPFVFWNLLFYTAQNYQKLETNEIKNFAKGALEIILTLSKDGRFLGATWFLGALFAVSVIYKIADRLAGDAKYKDFTLMCLFAVAAVIGFEINFKYMISRTLILSLFFAAGVVIKNNMSAVKAVGKGVGLPLMCFLIFCVIGRYGSANMGQNEYRYPFLFIIGSFLISYAILYFCKKFENLKIKSAVFIKNSITYIGRHSMDIVIWQFVAFRLVIILQMYLNGEELTLNNILSYFPMYDSTHGWWLAYTAVGVLAPIIWCSLLRLGISGKIVKKLHIA